MSVGFSTISTVEHHDPRETCTDRDLKMSFFRLFGGQSRAAGIQNFVAHLATTSPSSSKST